MYNTLSDLIHALELGTKLHISVVFLGNTGNEKTHLPTNQTIHDAPICNAAKSTVEGFSACFRCRNIVLKALLKRRKPLAGLCTNGVFEYCHPVLRKGSVAAVIFVGNILTENLRQADRLRTHANPDLINTMQTGFSTEDCRRTADLLESYIHFLLDTYGNSAPTDFDPILENMKSYIKENMPYDISLSDLAGVFNYNEKYIGRLFKSKTGYTVREYCNLLRIEQAKELLARTRQSVSDIAYRVGYNNITYFNRIFKEITGYTPKEYRKLSSVSR